MKAGLTGHRSQAADFINKLFFRWFSLSSQPSLSRQLVELGSSPALPADVLPSTRPLGYCPRDSNPQQSGPNNPLLCPGPTAGPTTGDRFCAKISNVSSDRHHFGALHTITLERLPLCIKICSYSSQCNFPPNCPRSHVLLNYLNKDTR